ncbi:dienelactone hydrolase family protein [Streptomyces lydicus]
MPLRCSALPSSRHRKRPGLPPPRRWRASAPHEIWVAPEADHAFFNDTGQRYAPGAATAAWRRVLDWYGTHLG